MTPEQLAQLLKDNPDLRAANAPVRPPPDVAETTRQVDVMQRQQLENRFIALWRQVGGPEGWQRNYRFDLPDSRMEFDFAWPELRIAVEVNGGQYKGARSGHGSVQGLERDATKQNRAHFKGWRLFVLTSSMVKPQTVETIARFANYGHG